MENICSICSKEEKYVDKRQKPDQDADNKDGYRVATDQGGVLEKERQSADRTTSKSTLSNVPKLTDGEQKTPQNGEADLKGTEKGSSHTAKAKTKKRKPDTDSSETSDSSSVQKTCYEPYNKDTRKDHGRFVISAILSDCQVEDIDVCNLIGEWAKSICRIQYPGGSGSGFRVGTEKRPLLCTAYHVAEGMMGKWTASIFGGNTPDERRLDSKDVWCVFNPIDDNYNEFEQNKFYFKPFCHYYDLETDIAILELKPNAFGNVMPPAFTSFHVPNSSEEFILIGHPNGWKKMMCKSTLNMPSTYISNLIQNVKKWHEDCPPDCEPDQHNVLDNPSRWLFHLNGNFNKGASGCPGVVKIPSHDASGASFSVVTVLLRGYPNWFYDKSRSKCEKQLPENLLIEQGANMLSVCKNMKGHKAELCKEIFRE